MATSYWTWTPMRPLTKMALRLTWFTVTNSAISLFQTIAIDPHMVWYVMVWEASWRVAYSCSGLRSFIAGNWTWTPFWPSTHLTWTMNLSLMRHKCIHFSLKYYKYVPLTVWQLLTLLGWSPMQSPPASMDCVCTKDFPCGQSLCSVLIIPYAYTLLYEHL